MVKKNDYAPTVAIEPQGTSYVALDLINWHEQGSLVLSPKFQRRSVWKSAARSYFIDTLLSGFPVPPLHIRLVRDEKRGLVREVVDGQQRVRALFDFINGRFRLSRVLDAEWAGKSYSNLDDDERHRLEDYRFQVYQYQGVGDETILEIFARMNTYSVPLNRQELRNGQYFGSFKQAVYRLALRHLEFWRGSRVFADAGIARMREAELVSELLIAQMDGLQDKKGSIDEYYKRLDEEWGTEHRQWKSRGDERPAQWLSRRKAELRFDATLSAINESVGDLLPDSEFRRVPLFYSLYTAMYHRLYGLPRFDERTPKAPLQPEEVLALREALEEISDLLSDKPDVGDLRGWKRDIVLAMARQTDNVGPRELRLSVIWNRARLGK